jgi:hypothetical protein
MGEENRAGNVLNPWDFGSGVAPSPLHDVTEPRPGRGPVTISYRAGPRLPGQRASVQRASLRAMSRAWMSSSLRAFHATRLLAP